MKLGDAFSTGYKSKLEDLREKLSRAKNGLRDSISLGTWNCVKDDSKLIHLILHYRYSRML